MMQQLNYDVLAAVFTDWAQLQYEVEAGEWFAADGKSIKGSVTDDDHYTVKKTLHQIVKQGNDYLVCVKANQQRLYRGIEQQSKTNQPSSGYQEHEQGHGRSTSWQVSVFDEVAAFGHEWPGIQSYIVVQRQGCRDGKPFDERQSYISSVVADAEQFHRIIRGHWSIENRLHWVKAVTFNEDNAPQSGRYAAANGSVIRNFFITLARSVGFTSMATAKRQFANQLQRIFPLLQ
ncbi:ISAs1 family transposase [Cyanobacteria bacterium FACHB-63]|nr:ISAs1 family transposase [Cyanobacteria bacterium FACHB-63]